MAKTIKIPPIEIDGEEYKVKSISLDTKIKIMNELLATKGETPSFDLFVNVLRYAGFKDDDIIDLDIATATTIGNTIITACNTKKKNKSS